MKADHIATYSEPRAAQAVWFVLLCKAWLALCRVTVIRENCALALC